jgi:hypothetical protein
MKEEGTQKNIKRLNFNFYVAEINRKKYHLPQYLSLHWREPKKNEPRGFWLGNLIVWQMVCNSPCLNAFGIYEKGPVFMGNSGEQAWLGERLG